MCDRCAAAFTTACEAVGVDVAGALLWGETSFPFGPGEEVERQMAEAVGLVLKAREAAGEDADG